MKKIRKGGCGEGGDGGCNQAESDDLTSLAEIVADYKRRGLRRSQQELERFRLRRGLPSIKDAIRAAALSKDERGRPYSHQRKNWNFWPDAIDQATKALVAASSRVEACTDFDDLHNLVTETISAIIGVRKLYAYDVSLRIGAWLRYWPTKVYLHSGTEEGAKNLGLDTSDGTLEIADFPAEFHELQPYQLEDILCNYKDCLSEFVV